MVGPVWLECLMPDNGAFLSLELLKCISLLSLPPAGSRLRKLRDNTLFIEKVKREDAGTYECQAQIIGRDIYRKLPVSVVINGQLLFQYELYNIWKWLVYSLDKYIWNLNIAVPPSVHLKVEEKKVLAGPETNVSLLCLVEGIPKPIISWTMWVLTPAAAAASFQHLHYYFALYLLYLLCEAIPSTKHFLPAGRPPLTPHATSLTWTAASWP